MSRWAGNPSNDLRIRPPRGDFVWLEFTRNRGMSRRVTARPSSSPHRYNRIVGLACSVPPTQVKGYPFEVAIPAA